MTVGVANTPLHVEIMATEAGKFLYVVEEPCSRPCGQLSSVIDLQSARHRRYGAISHPRANTTETPSYPSRFAFDKVVLPSCLGKMCTFRESRTALTVAFDVALETSSNRLCKLTLLTSSGFPGYIPPDAKLVL